MKCVINSCKNSNLRKNASSHVEIFHRIPKDRILRDKWLKAINRNPQKFSVDAAICCSRHFESHDYINSGLKGSFGIYATPAKKLKKGAVPTLFLDHEETSWEEGEKIQENTLYLKKQEKIVHVSVTRKSPRKYEYSDFDGDLDEVERDEVSRVKYFRGDVKSDDNFESNSLPINTKKTHWSDKKLIEKGMIFCLICGNSYKELQELSIHIEKEPKCKTRANLSFLSKNEAYIKNIQPVEVENETDAEEEACSDLEHDVEPGEVPVRKLKQVSMEDPLAENVRTPVKIAFTAKSKIKQEEIEIEEHPIETVEQNEEWNEKVVHASMMDAAKKNDEKIKKIYGLIKEVENQTPTASKRTFNQIGESRQSLSPKRIKLVQIPSRTLPKNQTIIRGPKKVLRVLLKKTQTLETPSFSTSDIEDIEKEKTSITVEVDHDYTVSETPVNKSDVKEDDAICCPICQEPARRGVIGCDFCEEWYHSSCLNLKKEDVKHLTKRKWNCPKCDPNYKQAKAQERTNSDNGSTSSEPNNVQLKAMQNGSPKLVRKDSSNPCLVPNCDNQTGLFHPIPTGEIQRRTWLSLLGMQDHQLSGPLKNIKLCQNHFTPDSYDDLELKKDAYPCLHVPCPLIPMNLKGSKIIQFKVRNTAFGQTSKTQMRLMKPPETSVRNEPETGDQFESTPETSAIQGYIAKCVVLNCTNPRGTYCHTFPKEDETQRQAWIKACIGKDDWDDHVINEPLICEDHFTPECFETNEDSEARKVLMPDAIPTLKLVLKKDIIKENTIVKNYGKNDNSDKVEIEKCAVPTCSSPKNVIFHKFPEDASMQSAWVAACDVDNINVKTSFVCEKHFVENSYKHDLVNELLGRPLRKLLRWDAVPTINVPFVVTAIKPVEGEVTENQKQIPDISGCYKLKCVVPLCSSQKDGFYHNFPKYGSKQYAAWCEACDLSSARNYKSHYKDAKICSQHFSKESYLFALRLKPDAVPNINVPYLVMLASDDTNNGDLKSSQIDLKLHHPSILSPNKKSSIHCRPNLNGAPNRASVRPDPLANLLQDCGISSASPEKNMAKSAEKKPKMRNFGLQCRMKSDEAESLKTRLKEEKKGRNCDRAALSKEREKNEKFNSEENITRIVKDWLRQRYNDKQTKFLMSKSIRDEINVVEEGLEPGEQRTSASFTAAAVAKAAIAAAGATLNNTSIEVGSVEVPNDDAIAEEPLELGEIRQPRSK